MKNPFESVDAAALKKYEEKIPEYEESWKTMSINELMERLNKEVFELYMEGYNPKQLEQEAYDVMNVARMIAMHAGGKVR